MTQQLALTGITSLPIPSPGTSPMVHFLPPPPPILLLLAWRVLEAANGVRVDAVKSRRVGEASMMFGYRIVALAWIKNQTDSSPSSTPC